MLSTKTNNYLNPLILNISNIPTELKNDWRTQQTLDNLKAGPKHQ